MTVRHTMGQKRRIRAHPNDSSWSSRRMGKPMTKQKQHPRRRLRRRLSDDDEKSKSSDGGSSSNSSNNHDEADQKEAFLPLAYVPQLDDILCGKTKEAFNHDGNQMFRITIGNYVPQYVSLTSRTRRGELITQIVDMIHNQGGKFLKRRGKQWIVLNNRHAREKVGHALRDTAACQSAKSTPSSVAAVAAVHATSGMADAGPETTAPSATSSLDVPPTRSEVGDFPQQPKLQQTTVPHTAMLGGYTPSLFPAFHLTQGMLSSHYAHIALHADGNHSLSMRSDPFRIPGQPYHQQHGLSAEALMVSPFRYLASQDSHAIAYAGETVEGSASLRPSSSLKPSTSYDSLSDSSSEDIPIREVLETKGGRRGNDSSTKRAASAGCLRTEKTTAKIRAVSKTKSVKLPPSPAVQSILPTTSLSADFFMPSSVSRGRADAKFEDHYQSDTSTIDQTFDDDVEGGTNHTEDFSHGLDW